MSQKIKIAILASKSSVAKNAQKILMEKYPTVSEDKADVIVALGGDGFMLETLHNTIDRNIPIYGMNRGTIGFLMNSYEENDLEERLKAAKPVTLHPLKMEVHTCLGDQHQALAINEVALRRQSRYTAKIRIDVDGVTRLDQLTCDGILLATSAGSTAYNFSAHGPIIPLGSNLLALTPISAFRPRRWRGALLPHKAKVTFTVLDSDTRPVSAEADYTEIRNVEKVVAYEDRGRELKLLFDPMHNLEERILQEQFLS